MMHFRTKHCMIVHNKKLHIKIGLKYHEVELLFTKFIIYIDELSIIFLSILQAFQLWLLSPGHGRLVYVQYHRLDIHRYDT